MVGFLRRNLLLILFSVLIVCQVLTWRAIVSLQQSVEWGPCGHESHPCYVRIKPPR